MFDRVFRLLPACRVDEFDGDLYGTGGIALEAAGVRVDDALRPISPEGDVLFQNVRVVGSALAGMRYLSERCGDGIATQTGFRTSTGYAGCAVTSRSTWRSR